MYLPILTTNRLLVQAPENAYDPKRISVSQNPISHASSLVKRFGYRTFPYQRCAAPPPRGTHSSRSFAITFLMGYEEVLTLGWPVLKRRATPRRVCGARPIGGENVWDEGAQKLLKADALRQLDQAGIAIGAHTCQHVHLTRVDPELARREISESKKILEEVLDIRSRS